MKTYEYLIPVCNVFSLSCPSVYKCFYRHYSICSSWQFKRNAELIVIFSFYRSGDWGLERLFLPWDHWTPFDMWVIYAPKEKVVVTPLSSLIPILQTSSWAFSARHKAGWQCKRNHSGFCHWHLSHPQV